MAKKITFEKLGRLGYDDSAEIIVDGEAVGLFDRLYTGGDWYASKCTVTGYCVTIWDDPRRPRVTNARSKHFGVHGIYCFGGVGVPDSRTVGDFDNARDAMHAAKRWAREQLA